MAEQFSHDLPTEPATLDAQQALNFLQMFEKWSLPAGTRAYLVHIDHEGTRRLKPVSDQASVINLRADLLAHLDDGIFYPEEMLRGLHSFAERRLMGMKIDPRPAATQEAARIATEATYEIEKLVEMLIREARREDEMLAYIVRATALRINELNSVLMGTVDVEGSVAQSEKELSGRRNTVFGPERI